MPASGTVVRRMLQFILALIGPVERMRLLMHHRESIHRFVRHESAAPFPARGARNPAPVSAQTAAPLRATVHSLPCGSEIPRGELHSTPVAHPPPFARC